MLLPELLSESENEFENKIILEDSCNENSIDNLNNEEE
jgi:hypothetical protein